MSAQLKGAPEKIPAGKMNMFATECSKPMAMNMEMGNQTPQKDSESWALVEWSFLFFKSKGMSWQVASGFSFCLICGSWRLPLPANP